MLVFVPTERGGNGTLGLVVGPVAPFQRLCRQGSDPITVPFMMISIQGMFDSWHESMFLGSNVDGGTFSKRFSWLVHKRNLDLWHGMLALWTVVASN